MPDNIYTMIVGKQIEVPSYQRAYAWDTSNSSANPKQVDTFFSDLTNYINSKSSSPYYFGHFLFEDLGGVNYGIIDGQQRLTTIIIFIAAIFRKLEKIGKLTENDKEMKYAMIKRFSTFPFSTVEYDRQFFRDFVIENLPSVIEETVSQRRIKRAFEFLSNKIDKLDEATLRKYLDAVLNASCSSQIVKDEAEAIQTFIFQNDRGKLPTTLEVIKAQFMLAIQLSDEDEIDSSMKSTLLSEIKNRFNIIYKRITEIEELVNEDDIVRYALRIYYRSLNEYNIRAKVNQELSCNTTLVFIRDFTILIEQCFNILSNLAKEDKHNPDIRLLWNIGIGAIVFPILIKAILLNPTRDLKYNLLKALASLALRHSTIKTRAEITSRLNDQFAQLDSAEGIQGIIDRIEEIKTTDDWWLGYWNNTAFKSALEEEMSTSTAKNILLAYEYILEKQDKNKYPLFNLDSGVSWEVEHIAPQKENPGSGYSRYTEKFLTECLNTIGNYLLISKSHNGSIGNKSFKEKRATYKYLAQQREVQDITHDKEVWTGNKVRTRKQKIIDAILKEY